MDFGNIDPMAYAALTFAIVGLVQFVRLIIKRDFEGAIVVAVSALAGALFAPFAAKEFGGHIGWFTGFLVGLNASGLITTTTRLGGNK